LVVASAEQRCERRRAGAEYALFSSGKEEIAISLMCDCYEPRIIIPSPQNKVFESVGFHPRI
jgi:hypothetical protein